MENIQKYSPYICLIIFTLTTIIICNFNNNNLKEYINLHNQHLKENVNLQNNHLKQKINLIEKEMDTFRQDTKSNFKKINEKIDKLINDNKSK
ncbi:MAG: putative secreted protein [Candidatus Phytoplasma solani]